ncbi:MAG: WXG100 family type VII secretion target [Peptococcaceae bacterium]|jgi:uncharacterized protein YukE|nr:WXG100 family type VII secretion target [Peptococcaceae bacterium]
MATQIFHEDTALKDAASRMGSIIQSMANIESAIVQIHNKTSPAWQGKAADQNTSNFQKLRQITDNYLDDAKQTKTALDQAVLTYEKTERAQVSQVSQLDTKGIFG